MAIAEREERSTTMANHHDWHPTWHKPEHAMQWDRVKEAVRRDWQQTKHDLHLGGHQLSQHLTDTVKQASGSERLPSINEANPQKIIGQLDPEWEAVAASVEYGYAARSQLGSAHTHWDDVVDDTLRTEWESARSAGRASGLWEDVRPHVRHGYGYHS
jgi:hypothetical protein